MIESFQCVSANLKSLHCQHQEYQQFKQLIKRQSKVLQQYITESSLISKEYQSKLFNVFNQHLSEFQKKLEEQYRTLKIRGKQFYQVKDEVSQFIKKQSGQVKHIQNQISYLQQELQKLEDQQFFTKQNEFRLDKTLVTQKINDNIINYREQLQQRLESQEQIYYQLQQQFYTYSQKVIVQQENSLQLTQSTQNIILNFCQKHKFIQCNSQQNSAKKPIRYIQNSIMSSKKPSIIHSNSKIKQSTLQSAYEDSINDRVSQLDFDNNYEY